MWFLTNAWDKQIRTWMSIKLIDPLNLKVIHQIYKVVAVLVWEYAVFLYPNNTSVDCWTNDLCDGCFYQFIQELKHQHEIFVHGSLIKYLHQAETISSCTKLEPLQQISVQTPPSHQPVTILDVVIETWEQQRAGCTVQSAAFRAGGRDEPDPVSFNNQEGWRSNSL